MVTYAENCGPTAPVAATKEQIGTITNAWGMDVTIIGVWCALGIDHGATTTVAEVPIVGYITLESDQKGFPNPCKFPLMIQGHVATDADLGLMLGGLVPLRIIPVNIPFPNQAVVTCYLTLQELPAADTEAIIGFIMEGP